MITNNSPFVNKSVAGSLNYLKASALHDKPILHRKCISIKSHPNEVYTGPYMRFPIKEQSTFDISSCIKLLELDPAGIGNDGITYTVTNNILTITDKNAKKYLLIKLLKKSDDLVKKTITGKFITGKFDVTESSFSAPINASEIKFEKTETANEYGNPIIGIKSLNRSLQVEIWKPVRRHKQGNGVIFKKEWVKLHYEKSVAYSAYNLRAGLRYKFLIRVRRKNSKNTKFGKWEYYHVIDNDGIYTIRQSKAEQRGANCSKGASENRFAKYAESVEIQGFKTQDKTCTGATNELSDNITNSGILHILTGSATNLFLNGNFINIDTPGDHIINCPIGSKLNSIEGSLIGIYRFDGEITTSFEYASNVVFVNNTTVVVDDMKYFSDCYNLENLDGTIIKCTGTDLYAMFRNTRIYRLPFISGTSQVTEMSSFVYGNENLISMSLIDVSNVTDITDAFDKCYNLASVAGFKGLKCDINISDCSMLTVNSLVNIITNAANVTAMGQRIMVLGTKNLEKLTDEQKAIAISKGWTLS